MVTRKSPPMLRGRLIPTVLLAAVLLGACTAAAWPPAPALSLPPDREPGVLPDSIVAKTVQGGLWRCTFRYRPDPAQPKPERINLAGSFNGWNPDATRMTGPDDAGRYTATLDLSAGVYHYKFVLDGGRWIHDPENPRHVHDGHGGRNSELRLGRVAHLELSPGVVGDGAIDALALAHVPAQPLYFQRLTDDRALFRLRTLAHDVEQVWVAPQGGPQVAMTVVNEDEPFALWEAVASIPQHENQDTAAYTFVLADGALRASSPQTYGVPVTSENEFKTPDWAKHAVWYQIMVDRFRNGDPSNDRQPVRPWTSAWFEPSPWEKEKEQEGQTFYKWYVFDRQYGGDLQGLMDKLPYLKELGVNAIYLNPVFKAESHHKYNAETYLHIDDHFGVKGDYEKVKDIEDHTDPTTWQWTPTDRLFLEFLRKAHASGFKVIIDGVFNHVGTAHPAFQDVKRHGRKSKYADWFNVTSWDPFEYEGWAGHDALPVFKKSPEGLASDQVKQYIFNVTRRWMDPDGDGDPSDGIDGWRLDVPNEIAAPFWVEWRQVVKSINPDAYISGEIWERADAWLDGKHFDAVMNYEFSRAVVSWVFDQDWKISVSEFDRRLRSLRLAYPREATLVLQDLMNSHDTDRIASMALNPDRAYDNANRIQDNGPNYNNAKPTPECYKKARLAALIQMTYVGAPMVYYGDEAGMWGADDPTCRKPMLWKDLAPYEKPDENYVMDEQLAHYQRAIALRNAHPALRVGHIRTLLTDDDADVWTFLRKSDDEQLVVALNASGKEARVAVPLPHGAPEGWQMVYGGDDAVQGRDGVVRLTVPPLSGVVLHAKTPK